MKHRSRIITTQYRVIRSHYEHTHTHKISGEGNWQQPDRHRKANVIVEAHVILLMKQATVPLRAKL